MARVWLLTHFLPLCLAVNTLAFDSSLIKVPQSGRIAGVFMIPEGGEYIFNSTDARAACLFLNVTIATKAQMEKAILHGLQLCKFGWIDGEVAVIPRTTGDPNCGRNNVGLVTWNAKADKLFGAFCFNAADLKSSTTMTVLTRASTTAASPARTKPSSTQSTTKAPKLLAPRSSAAPPPVQSTRSARFPSTSPPLKSISSSKPSLSHPVTSSTSVTRHASSTAASSTSIQASTSSIPSASLHTTTDITGGSVLLQSVSSAKASLGAVPTVFLVLGIILLLLTAAGAAWYCKLKRSLFPFWPRGQQKDDIETEMWKHTDSEMDLHSHQGEEETDRKYSSDVTLCVNPDIKTNSSE